MFRRSEAVRYPETGPEAARSEDMAGIAIYLASRAGAYVTGTVIPVDGGISTR